MPTLQYQLSQGWISEVTQETDASYLGDSARIQETIAWRR